MTLRVENTFLTLDEESPALERRAHSAPPRLRTGAKGQWIADLGCGDEDQRAVAQVAAAVAAVAARSRWSRAQRCFGEQGPDLEPEGEPEWLAQAAVEGEGGSPRQDTSAADVLGVEPVHFYIGEEEQAETELPEDAPIDGGKDPRLFPRPPGPEQRQHTGTLVIAGAAAALVAFVVCAVFALLGQTARLAALVESLAYLELPRPTPLDVPSGSVQDVFSLGESLAWAQSPAEVSRGAGIPEAFYKSEGFAWLGDAEEMAVQRLREAAGAAVEPVEVEAPVAATVVAAVSSAMAPPPSRPAEAAEPPQAVSREEISARRKLMERRVLAMQQQGYEVVLAPSLSQTGSNQGSLASVTATAGAAQSLGPWHAVRGHGGAEL